MAQVLPGAWFQSFSTFVYKNLKLLARDTWHRHAVHGETRIFSVQTLIKIQVQDICGSKLSEWLDVINQCKLTDIGKMWPFKNGPLTLHFQNKRQSCMSCTDFYLLGCDIMLQHRKQQS